MEKIEVGDKVYSRNRATGDTELRPVIALTPPHRDKLLELRIEGEGTALRPGLDHPFWVRRSTTDTGHWIIAANLVSGELLETMEGSWRKIDSVAPVKGKETVYNFTVDQNHDYFVGEAGFLVHNANCNCRSGNFQHEFKHAPKFGVPGNWNNQNAALFEQALEGIVSGPNTVQYPVNFRGQFDGTAFLDQPTGLCAVFDANGELGAAWDLGANQVEDLVVNGVLH